MATTDSTAIYTAPTTSQDELRWQQLNDASADGQFIYAVITTGIYCRPGCPSRHPKRDNVRFFASVAEAEAAGFRACKRCHPQSAPADTPIKDRIVRLCRFIETAAQEPSLEQLAKLAGLSSYHLQRQFKSITGLSPKAYAKAHRQKTTPPKQGTKKSMTLIHYACGDSSLGKFLVARSEKGVCAILLGDSHNGLLTDLTQRFPQAELKPCEQDFAELLHQLIQLIEHPQQSSSLPLDIRGTVFQQKVWQALQQIPAGETRSYTDIALAIGAPKSVRAVAGACAANAIAIAIPCHRVLRSDGSLSGYRWGVERKKILLQREADTNNK